jgi:hypothetical protein
MMENSMAMAINLSENIEGRMTSNVVISKTMKGLQPAIRNVKSKDNSSMVAMAANQ